MSFLLFLLTLGALAIWVAFRDPGPSWIRIPAGIIGFGLVLGAIAIWIFFANAGPMH